MAYFFWNCSIILSQYQILFYLPHKYIYIYWVRDVGLHLQHSASEQCFNTCDLEISNIVFGLFTSTLTLYTENSFIVPLQILHPMALWMSSTRGRNARYSKPEYARSLPTKKYRYYIISNWKPLNCRAAQFICSRQID